MEEKKPDEMGKITPFLFSCLFAQSDQGIDQFFYTFCFPFVFIVFHKK
jgi:hypothetical protein